jgi:drug/metabolite transporter (DMT)-like permease
VAPEAAYGLVLLAAVAHAGWNAWVKSAEDRLATLAVMRLFGLALGLAALPFAAMPSPGSWLPLAVAAAAHFAYYALLLASYRIGDLGVVHGIARGTSPLLLAAVGGLALEEYLTAGQTIAVALSSAGIGVLALGAGASRRTVALALATGVSIAAYSMLGGIGVRRAGTVIGFQAWLEIATGVGVLGWTLATRGAAPTVAALARTGRSGLSAGAAAVLGYLAYLSAVAVLPIAPVAALRESSVLFSAVIGTFALGEPFGPRRIAAAFLVTLGVVALGVLG